jgi:hypothetical protein
MRVPNSGDRKLTELDFIRLKKFIAAGTFPQLAARWAGRHVQRTSQLADTHRASVTLMYVPARGQGVPPNAASRARRVPRLTNNRLALPLRPAGRRT